MGAAEDDENQWEFRRNLELTENEKKRIVSEVMRLVVEIMYGTQYPHIYIWRQKLQAEGRGSDRAQEYVCSGKGGDGEMGLQVEGEVGREPPQYCLWSSAKVVVCRMS